MTGARPLYIFGAGGHGKVVAEAVHASGTHRLRGFLDDDRQLWGRSIDGFPILGNLDTLELLESGTEVALALGANEARANLARALLSRGRRLATIVHPSAVLARGARLGEGCYVGPLAVIHADAELGRGVIVNSSAVVEHDVRLGDWVHVSPRVALGGAVRVGEGAHVGLGAVVLPGLTIGSWATLGAGAVLTRAMPGGVTAVGIPARWRDALGRTG
ncbi:MAG TPA: acetyltransferase [Vicinamibacteria bacterium]|nr:acetyltransferase [Vicinamibacteria bacterium]